MMDRNGASKRRNAISTFWASFCSISSPKSTFPISARFSGINSKRSARKRRTKLGVPKNNGSFKENRFPMHPLWLLHAYPCRGLPNGPVVTVFSRQEQMAKFTVLAKLSRIVKILFHSHHFVVQNEVFQANGIKRRRNYVLLQNDNREAKLASIFCNAPAPARTALFQEEKEKSA